MNTQTTLDTATQVLEKVRAAAGTAMATEVETAATEQSLTRFANSFIHQNVTDHTVTVRLRLHAGDRTAASSTTVTTPEGLDDLVARTLAAVRMAPTDPTWPGLTPPTPLAGTGEYDEATAAAAPSERADRVRSFVAATGLESAGYCRTTVRTSALINSAGQVATMQVTEAAMDGIARIDGSDGVARHASARLADLDGARLGAVAGAKARAATDAAELPPGKYEVVLEPNAVADLLSHLAMVGFNGKAYVEGRSFVELGAAQFDPSITLVDDPLAAGLPALAYDGEGTPKRRLVLVDEGTSAAVAHDRRTAARTGVGAASTGHAIPGGGGPFGAVALHLALLPGTGGPTDSQVAWLDPVAAPLVKNVERGVLVTDFWYTRVLDPKSLVVTGLTRNGVWLIEDGKITTPLHNFRFTQSYPQALSPGQVRGVGPVATVLPGAFAVGARSVPALQLASWHFTGGASG